MVFKKTILIPVLLVIFVSGVILWKSFSQVGSAAPENIELPAPVKPIDRAIPTDTLSVEDLAIEKQLDRDRQEQQQTKYLKTRLEQTNLELEQEKAIAQINRLKSENGGTFDEAGIEGQKNLPDIKIEYIGGDNKKKEAIIAIAGINYQVTERSCPTNNVQVVSISDSGVTFHFSAPQELTKTIDYKPE